MRAFLSSAAVGALALSVGGCGGTAMAPPAVPTSAPTLPPPATAPVDHSFSTSEYDLSTSAKNSNAAVAWQHGATGKGIKIGFVDTGIYTSNPDLAGKIDSGSGDAVSSRPMSDEYGHGTALASIAAGAQNGSMIEGVAYDASVVMIRVDKPGTCNPACDLVNIGKGITQAAQAGAKIINLSISGDVGSGVTDAVKNAARSGVIFVVSAGNDGTSAPTDFARAIAAAAPGQVIIAGALGQPSGDGVDYNQMWASSNRAGSFQDWYLGAPGYYVNAASKDSWDTFTGTSFAAPGVAGAIALLLQAFPNLTPQEIVQVLLTTADDIGASGVDNVFGHGRLNIGNAFKPVGATSLAGSKTAVSAIDNGSAPAAAGDAMAQASFNAVVLDAYSRAFTLNLARTLKTAAPGRPLERSLSGDLRSSLSALGGLAVSLGVSERLASSRMGFSPTSFGPYSASDRLPRYMSLVSDTAKRSAFGFSMNGDANGLERALGGRRAPGFIINQDVLASPGFASRPTRSGAARHDFGLAALTVSRESGLVDQGYAGDTGARYRLSRMTLDKRVGRANLSLSVANLKEGNTVLGGRFSQALVRGGANSVFLDATASADLARGWSFSAAARRGWTSFSGSTLATSAYALNAQKMGVWRSDDQLSLSVSQPLRVEAGGLSMMLPTTFSYTTMSPTLGQSYLSLSPSGRELVTEVGYLRRFGLGSIGLSSYARRNPGHAAAAAPDLGAAVQLKLRLGDRRQ